MSEEEIRLDQTKKVFEAISKIITNGSCTYRYLIYDMLGFKAENYIDLMSGLIITNAIVDLEDFQQEIKQLKEVMEELKEYIKSYNVFKNFSFPLMKREEENQIKSSILYEFDTSIKKELLQILDKVKGEKYEKS